MPDGPNLTALKQGNAVDPNTVLTDPQRTAIEALSQSQVQALVAARQVTGPIQNFFVI